MMAMDLPIILAVFDDELIMDMTADKAVGEVTHSQTEKISGDCLETVSSFV